MIVAVFELILTVLFLLWIYLLVQILEDKEKELQEERIKIMKEQSDRLYKAEIEKIKAHLNAESLIIRQNEEKIKQELQTIKENA